MTVAGVRIDNLETRIERHEEMLEKITDAQTQMMVSLAKLHTTVRILLGVLSLAVGLDITAVIG